MKRSPWHLIIIRISHWCCRHHKEFCHCCRAGPWSRGRLSTLHGIAGRCLSLGGSVWKILSGDHFNWGNVSMPKLLLGSFQRICWPFRSVQEPIFSEGCSTWDAACMLTELLGWEFVAQLFVGKHEIKKKTLSFQWTLDHFSISAPGCAQLLVAAVSCANGFDAEHRRTSFFFCSNRCLSQQLRASSSCSACRGPRTRAWCSPSSTSPLPCWSAPAAPPALGLGSSRCRTQGEHPAWPCGIGGSQLPRISFPCRRRWLSRLRYQRLDGLSTGRFQTAVCLEKSYWR